MTHIDIAYNNRQCILCSRSVDYIRGAAEESRLESRRETDVAGFGGKKMR
jgi:hypothetical protein